MGIVPFNFDGAPIRVLEISGDPWFVGNDVAEALGYAKPRNAVSQHCKRATSWGALNQGPLDLDPQTKIIPEGDVYRLIVRSNKPSAERFEALVMDEILPTIRKTGGYGRQPATIDLSDPAQLVPLLTSYAQRTQIAEAKVSEMSPKAEAFDRLESSEGSQLPSVVAKVLSMPQNRFFKELHAKNWIFKRGKVWVGYEDKVKRGYLENDMKTFTDASGEERTSVQLKITPKGMARLAQIFPEEGRARLN